MSSTSEPREPMALRIQMSEIWKTIKMGDELSQHIVPQHVQAKVPCSERDRPLCAYFFYYYNHFLGCNMKTPACNQCSKLIRWMEHHAQSCKSLTLEGCFQLCRKFKEKRFRLNSGGRMYSEEHEDFTPRDKDSDTSSGASSGSFTYTAAATNHPQPNTVDAVGDVVFSPGQVRDADAVHEQPQTCLVRTGSNKSTSSVESNKTFQKSFSSQISQQNINNPDLFTEDHAHDIAHPMHEDPGDPQGSYMCQARESIRGRLEGNQDEDKMEVEAATKEVNHRAYTRQCLLNQLRRNGGYRENDHWVRVRTIGSGGFGTCYCILDNESNYLLAMKEGVINTCVRDTVRDTTDLNTSDYMDETYICLKLARLISSKPLHVVEFFGANIIPSPYSTTVQLFEELMSASLYDMLVQNGPLATDDVTHYAYQMFDALDFLHTKLKIIHCDIKPANLLLDTTNQRLKVADFGCAVLMRECNCGPVFSGSPAAGTLHFNPPEFYRDQTCSVAFDIWQAGCCVLNMCTGRRPWRHLYMDTPCPQAKMHQRYLIGQQDTHVIPTYVPEGLKRLLCDCLHPDYNRRPTAQQCQDMLVALEGDNVKRSIDQVMRDESTCLQYATYGMRAGTAYRSQTSVSTNRVDVYVCTEISHCKQALRSGWLGSIECPSSTTSTCGQLWQHLEASLPVIKQLPSDCSIVTCDQTPLAIWQGLKFSDCVPMEIWDLVSTRNPIVIARWRT